MARSFSTDNYLTAPSAFSDFPVTASIWFKPDALTATMTLFSLGNTGEDKFMSILVRGAVANDPIEINDENNTFQFARGGSCSVGVWQNACAVWESATSRRIYLDGTQVAENLDPDTSGWAAGRDTFGIGALIRLSSRLEFDGDEAECGVWNVVLDDAQIAALAKGYSPLLVRPQGLVHYWPVIGRASPEIDRVSGAGMALTGTPPVAEHPRVFYPRRRGLIVPAAAGVTGTGALTAGDAAASGAGTSGSTGTGTPAAGAATASGTGASGSTGTGAAAAGESTVAGTGTVADPAITGTGDLQAGNAAVEGAGESGSSGTGTLQAGAASVDGSGVVGNVIVGSGALVAGDASIAGAGDSGSVGTGALSAQAAIVAGIGIVFGWVDAPSASGAWTEEGAANDVWTPATQATGTWTRQ